MNFCGSQADPSRCSDPAITDPYTWLKDFFAACPGCEVDAVAVHWYNCDLPSLEAYIEGNASLEGFVQFGKPIWLTEFSCDGAHSVADNEASMKAAVPYPPSAMCAPACRRAAPERRSDAPAPRDSAPPRQPHPSRAYGSPRRMVKAR